ncbi:MAG TPA: lipid-A-disaccharide synthase, partial [Flavisolibacter sp.]
KIIYYISPQVWAWKEGRVKSIKQVVDKMLVILPFEEKFYKDKWDYKVEYVGHPLVQVIEEFRARKEFHFITWSWRESSAEEEEKKRGKELIALLPGSRKQEIEIKLPIMLEASKNFPDYRIVIAQAPGQPIDFYKRLISDNYSNIEIAFEGQTYTLLNQAKAALVTSGTATLETALFGVPEVVCYKGSNISYQIAKRLVRIKYISLVNLIMDKQVVTELIQNDLTVENITRELGSILHDEEKIKEMKKDYSDLRQLLQKENNASARAAQEIVGFLQSNA